MKPETRMPRYPDSQPETIPAPTREEWLQAGEAATDLGLAADMGKSDPMTLEDLGLLVVGVVGVIAAIALAAWGIATAVRAWL